MPKQVEHNDYDSRQVYSSARPAGYDQEDVFGNEESHDIRYKTLSWPMVAMLMIAEIVSNGKIIRINARSRSLKQYQACCHFRPHSQWCTSILVKLAVNSSTSDLAR